MATIPTAPNDRVSLQFTPTRGDIGRRGRVLGCRGGKSVASGSAAERLQVLDLHGDLVRIDDKAALAESGLAADSLDLGFQP